jgi:hypothetical protein
LNTQESEQLTRFLQQLIQAQPGGKDAEAERLIRDACASQPDSFYLLVQRSLLLEQALANAQAEISKLRQEQESTRSGGSSFLNSNGWGNTPTQSAPPQRAASFAPAQQAPLAPAPTPGWGSGLLGTVAATAGGVVAGSFLFQGIESLMGHRANAASPLSGNTPAPESHAPPEKLVSNQPDETAMPAVDLDSLGPDDETPDWA